MATETYLRRVAMGQCPRCATPVAIGQTYCGACKQEMRDDYATLQSWRQRHPASVELACCGRWHCVTMVPFVAPCCGRVFQEVSP